MSIATPVHVHVHGVFYGARSRAPTPLTSSYNWQQDCNNDLWHSFLEPMACTRMNNAWGRNNALAKGKFYCFLFQAPWQTLPDYWLGGGRREKTDLSVEKKIRPSKRFTFAQLQFASTMKMGWGCIKMFLIAKYFVLLAVSKLWNEEVMADFNFTW